MNPTPTGIGIPSQIGPYRIEREIARGGMGIVYLARDTHLDRAVAIKALPDDVAADPERLARFEREAKTLASLNHPNVAGIYGIETTGGRRYLVLEYIEGETLATRLSRGKLPVGESVELCAQIAAGVEAAHESGVIHRDLKPGNVMITPGEHVKVLDFGLAKGKVAETESGVLPHSPTTTDSPTLSSPTLPHSPSFLSPATLPGVILGTAAYLSPEQARGKAVDRRTDIWSFGCVLYECLTGKRVFEGETVSDTIAKLLERDVDWKPLPGNTPLRIRELLQRCLEKDPRKRLRDIGEARLALEAARAGATAVNFETRPPASRNPLVRWREGMRSHGFLFATGLILGALLALRMWGPWGSDDSHAIRSVLRLSIAVPPNLRALEADLSPDGTMDGIIAEPRATGNATATSDMRPRIYVRHLSKTAFESIRGTEGALEFEFTADSRWILFLAPVSERSAQRRVLRVPIDGSVPPVPFLDWRDEWAGSGLFLSSGEMMVATRSGKSYARVPRDGKPPSTPTQFDTPDSSATFSLSRLLPGERAALLQVVSYHQGAYHQGVGVVDLRSGKTRILVRDGGRAHYARTGHILFARHDVLYAVPFDLGKLAMTGDAVPVMDDLRVGPGWANASFDMSQNGILQVSPGGAGWAGRHAVIVTPGGQVSDWSGERQAFEGWFSVSGDGTRSVAVVASPKSLYEIWVSERGRRTSRRVISSPEADCGSPCWSPDGAQIAFLKTRQSDDDGIYAAPASGIGPSRLLFRTGSTYSLGPQSWSPDGKKILAVMQGGQKTQLVCVSAAGVAEGESGTKPEPLFGGGAEHSEGSFSPDGHWIAYVSDETGKAEVYVSEWDGNAPTGEALTISDGGGNSPRWSRDGHRLYYHTPQDKMMLVSISSKPRPAASSPTLAWDLDALRIAVPVFDILPDGSLLGVQKSEGEGDVTRFDLTINFFDELKRRMAAAKK